jgi:magnesium chelatase family protein
MNHALIKKHCHLTDSAQTMLKTIFDQMKLSARSYDRLIKVGQTIADLTGEPHITEQHIAESVQFRNNLSINDL